MRRMVASLAFALCASVAFARDMPISNGRLVSPLDANQQMITNLPAAFWEGHGGGGVDTNTVKAIIESEVGGTNTLVHSLSPAIDYTTAVSNDFHVSVTNLSAVKRDLTNNVCAATTRGDYIWTMKNSLQAGFTMVKGPYFDKELITPEWVIIVKDELDIEYYGASGFFDEELEPSVAIWFDYTDEFAVYYSLEIPTFATSGQPFVTADNVPSTNGLVTASVTNGLCTVAAAQAMTNGLMRSVCPYNFGPTYPAMIWQGGYGLRFGYFENDSFYDGPVYIDNFGQIGASSWDAIHVGDETIGAHIETASTNAATSVVSNYLDYALEPLTGTSVNLASGQIGNLSLTSAQTALTVNLDFSAAADRSGDCLLYLINAADTSLDVGPASSVTPIGYTASEAMKAGTNLVMFTRLAYDGGKSVINVAIKEVK